VLHDVIGGPEHHVRAIGGLLLESAPAGG